MAIRKYILTSVAIIGAFTLIGVFSVSAQTAPSIVLTWKASSFFPSDYAGKTIPTPGAPVSVAALVLRNGRVVDVRQAVFTWYVDERFMQKGTGTDRFTFTATQSTNGSHFVRVEIALAEEELSGSVRIPTASPTVTIDASLPNRLALEENITIAAIPLFFNVSSINNLEFTWLVNGVRHEGGSQNRLTLNVAEVPVGITPVINVTVFSKNLLHTGEYAKGEIQIYTRTP